ncbi:hypothetical protein KVP08_023550 (plasmid) [Shewanella putrefaciens]|nr:hypothetical protein KVP08_023550 [Shewanella putrefaciens]
MPLPSISLINDNAKRNIPANITSSKVGVSFHSKWVGEDLEKIRRTSPWFSVVSDLYPSEVVAIFRHLHDEITSSKPENKAAQADLIHYHNLCANHIALLFIVLTGMRLPMLSLSINNHTMITAARQYLIKDFNAKLGFVTI